MLTFAYPFFHFSWRRLLRYRLSTLLFAVTIVSLVLGLFGVRWYRNLQEKWAIEALRESGATVIQTEGTARRVWVGGDSLNDEKLGEMVPQMVLLPNLNELDIVSAPITDKGLMQVRRLQQVDLIYIHETQASEEAITALGEAMPEVEVRREKPDPISTKIAMRQIYRSAVVALAASPDQQWIVTGSGDGTLRWWQSDDVSPTETVNAHKEWLFTAAFSPDGKMLATGGGDHRIKFWNVKTRQLAFELTGHTDDVHSLVFSLDGRWLYSAGDDRIVRIWDVTARRQLGTLDGHGRQIPNLALSADGRMLASACRDGIVRVFSVDGGRGELLHELEGNRADVSSVAFTPDGAHVASAGYDRIVRVWIAATGQPSAELTGHGDFVFALNFSPDGKTLATGAGDGTVRLWDWENGATTQVFKGQANVSSVHFDRAGRTLMTTAADGTIFFRDLARVAVRRVLRTRFGDRGLDLPTTTGIGSVPSIVTTLSQELKPAAIGFAVATLPAGRRTASDPRYQLR